MCLVRVARARLVIPSICYQAFALFDSLPLEGDSHEAPPARPPPGWKERFTARQKVAGCLILHAALAPKVRPRQRVLAAIKRNMQFIQ